MRCTCTIDCRTATRILRTTRPPKAVRKRCWVSLWILSPLPSLLGISHLGSKITHSSRTPANDERPSRTDSKHTPREFTTTHLHCPLSYRKLVPIRVCLAKLRTSKLAKNLDALSWITRQQLFRGNIWNSATLQFTFATISDF